MQVFCGISIVLQLRLVLIILGYGCGLFMIQYCLSFVKNANVTKLLPKGNYAPLRDTVEIVLKIHTSCMFFLAKLAPLSKLGWHDEFTGKTKTKSVVFL